MFMRVSSSAAGGEEPGAATAGAACCSAGTARKMGCSIAMGKSSSFMTASCRAPSRLPFTASFASPAGRDRHGEAAWTSARTSRVTCPLAGWQAGLSAAFSISPRKQDDMIRN